MVLDLSSITRESSSGTVRFDPAKLAAGKGFCSCTCSDYLHTNWCWHVTTDGLIKGLIQSIPPTLRPERVHSRDQGRIPAARRGGALGFD